MNPLWGWLQLQTLRRRLRMPAEDLRRLQEMKLRRLVAHAYARVPYYQQRFDRAGVTPEQIKTLDDLRRIPLTHKSVWRSVPWSERISDGCDVDRLIRRRTSGSMGMPVEVLISPSQFNIQTLYSIRSLFESGIRWRDRYLQMSNYPDRARQWYHLLGLLPWQVISAFEPPERVAALMRTHRPDAIGFRPQYLRYVAHQIQNDGGEPIPIRIAFTGNEPLTEGTRAVISETFAAEVFDRYGTTETFTIAWECRAHRGLHVDADHVIVECLKDGEPTDGEGEVFVTNLDAYAMPFIRYGLEDVATLSAEPCPCGCTFPTIGDLRGRVADVVLLADGCAVDALALAACVDRVDGIVSYRLVQDKVGHLRVELIPGPGFPEMAKSTIADAIRAGCRQQIAVEVNTVDDLPQSPAGKWRLIISKVRPSMEFTEP